MRVVNVDRDLFYLKVTGIKSFKKRRGGRYKSGNIIDGLHGSKAGHGPRAIKQTPSVDWTDQESLSDRVYREVGTRMGAVSVRRVRVRKIGWDGSTHSRDAIGH